MNNLPQSSDLFQEQPSRQHDILNTLTMLTFIGCAIGYIGLLLNISSWKDYENRLAEARQMEEELSNSEVGSNLLKGSAELLERSHEHRYVLAGSALLFTTMCLVGAMRMRKRRKSGYPIYVIGELAPLVISAALLGFGFFNGVLMLLSAIVAVVFVILYTLQRKHLVNN